MMREKIKQFIEKGKKLFKKRPRLIMVVVVILALSLPFVINQVLKQQDLRQHASSAPGITFNFTPGTKSVAIGETFEVKLILNTGTDDIGSLKYTLTYDSTKLQFTAGPPGTALTVLNQTTTATSFTPTYVNTSRTPVMGNGLTLHTFTFQTLAPGVANIKLNPDILATALTYDTYVPVDNKDSISADVTIGGGNSALSPTPVCNATNKALTCSCTEDSQCSSGACNPLSGYPGQRICVPYLTIFPSISVTLTPTGTIDPNLDTSLTAPTNLQPNGNIIPGSTALTWTASAKASGGYTVKITDDAIAEMKDMNDDCVHSTETPLPTTGGVCRNIPAGTNTYQYTFLAGHHYHWFVHSRSTANKYGNPANAIIYADPNYDAALTAPTNLQPNGTIIPGLTALTWTASDKATGGYFVRLTDKTTNEMWDADCGNQKVNDTYPTGTGGVCRIVGNTTYPPYNFQAGHSYSWWVHTRDTAGKYGAAALAEVTTSNITSPTPTPLPTTTIENGKTYLKLTVSLPGIGTASGNTADPKRKTRTATVTVLDSSNTPIVTEAQGTLTYSSTTGTYVGIIGLGDGITALTGGYIVKAKLDNTLYKRLPGITTIIKGQVNSAIPDTLIAGDLNGDNTLGVFDWTYMISCIKDEAACTDSIRNLADLNDNGEIDELDVQILQRGFALRNGD